MCSSDLRAVPVIDLAEADHTFPVQGKGMDRQVVLQRIVQRLMEKGGVDVLLSFGKQARKRNGDKIFVLADLNPLGICRLLQISAPFFRGCQADQVAHLAGNPFRPQCSIQAQIPVIFRIRTDISGFQSKNRVVEFLDLSFQLRKPFIEYFLV